MSTVTLINQYEVIYLSNKFVPQIKLWNKNNIVGQLSFMPNGSALIQDTMPSDQVVNLYYHLEDFGNIMVLLQSGMPTYLFSGNENGIMAMPPNMVRLEQGRVQLGTEALTHPASEVTKA